MSGPLSHDDARELIALAALEALSPEDRAALEVHAGTCAECARDLAALRDAAASLGASLPPRPMAAERSARVRARLLARATADRSGVTPLRAPAPTMVGGARLLAAAALLIAAGALLWGMRERSDASRLAGALAQAHDSAAVTQRLLDEQQATIEALTGPGVKVIDVGAARASAPSARMFWNQPANRWTFVAYHLPAVALGRTLQLWLVTRDQRKVSAGTFMPSTDGAAFVQATYALARDSLVAIAVTDEPAGGSPQPTSTPFLVGAAPKGE